MNSSFTSLDHAAGVDISKATSLDEVLNVAGFNFEVEQTTVHTPEGDEIPNKRLLRRSDNDYILGVVGGKYTPVSNRAMLEPFHDLVTDYGAKYESAGVIKGGRKCWISATLPESFSVPGRTGDVINQRIVSLIGHDGLGRNSYFSIANRLMCNNQIRLITSSGSESQFRVSHTKNWENQHADASAGFRAAVDSSIGFQQVAGDLNEMLMTPDEVEVFARHLYKIHKQEVVSPQAVKRGERLKELFVRGQGNVGESRWDALNAVTELLDHHSVKKTKKKVPVNRLMENRFVSNNLGGYGDSLKQRAMSLLLNKEVKFK